MPHTLIATLGRSPGAVTGLVRAIEQDSPDGIHIDRLHLLQTSHPDVKRAARIVEEEMKHFGGIIITADSLNEADYVTTQAAAFQKIITDAIDQHARAGQQIVMGIAGGRTSMGAMLAISAQLYSEVTHIYHLWVDSSLEASGDVRDLRALVDHNRALYDDILNPPRDKRKLVPLPISSFGRRELVEKRKLIAVIPSHAIPAHPDLRDDLASARDILRVLPRRVTVENALRFVDVLEAVKRGEPLQDDVLLDVFQQEGITDADELVNLMKRYANRIEDVDTLVEGLIRDFEDSKHYWARGLHQTYLAHREDIAVGMSAAQVILGLLAIFLKV